MVFTNCSKDDDNNGTEEPVTPVVKGIHNVYVAIQYDTLYSATGHSKSCAGYYYNGAIVPLKGQANNAETFANAICVDGTTVYTAGMEDYQAVYWKGTEVNYLPEGTGASGICVKNNVVYICGYEATSTGDQACCWINNTKYVLDNGTRTTGITADDDGHVYVVGYYYDRSTGVYSMRYWTDAETTGISRYGINSSSSCEGRAVCLDYTHTKNGHPFICLAGMESQKSSNGGVVSANKQWVERKETALASASGNEVMSIDACNGKLYTCGNDVKVAKYWVTTIGSNGEGDDLQAYALSDGSTQWYATGISVCEDDAYVVGYNTASTYFSPTIWKNGAKYLDITHTGIRIQPNGVYVVSRPAVDNTASDSLSVATAQ